jgi:hypothetical protein
LDHEEIRDEPQIVCNRAGYPDRRCHADGVRRASYGIYTDDAYKDAPVYHRANSLVIFHTAPHIHTASRRNGPANCHPYP